MHPTRYLLIGPLGLLLACGDSSSTGPARSAAPRIDTPYEYSLSFLPDDPAYGRGGAVSGIGAIWRWGADGSFVLELPVAPVTGTSFGGTELVVALKRYQSGQGNLPEPGQYDIGTDTPAFNGRAWLRDPSRIWSTDVPGFFLISEWLPDGRVEGMVALQLTREERDDAGQVSSFQATATGSFTAAALAP